MTDIFSKIIFDIQSQEHGSILMILILGALFGALIQYARVSKFDNIASFSMLEDMTLPKIMFLTIGLSSIGFYFLHQIGIVEYHIKPIMLGGLVIGAIMFGIAMAIFGSCPGTGPISLADGNIDIFVGIIGGLVAGAVFTIGYPTFKDWMNPSFGQITILDFFETNQHMIVLNFGILLTLTSFLIPIKRVKKQ